MLYFQHNNPIIYMNIASAVKNSCRARISSFIWRTIHTRGAAMMGPYINFLVEINGFRRTTRIVAQNGKRAVELSIDIPGESVMCVNIPLSGIFSDLTLRTISNACAALGVLSVEYYNSDMRNIPRCVNQMEHIVREMAAALKLRCTTKPVKPNFVSVADVFSHAS